jgi:hypothetical protein
LKKILTNPPESTWVPTVYLDPYKAIFDQAQFIYNHWIPCQRCNFLDNPFLAGNA